MNKYVTSKLLQNPKLLNHLMENSYWIKNLNRDPNIFNTFQKEMKTLYKERATDKIASAIDGVEMLSSIIETI